MRVIRHYKAFVSYEYFWIMYVAAPLALLLAGALARYFIVGKNLGLFLFAVYVPMGVLFAEAGSDRLLFGGFLGARALGSYMLTSTPESGSFVLSAVCMDMLRRLLWCTLGNVIVPLMCGGNVWVDFIWENNTDSGYRGIQYLSIILILFAFAQLAACLSRYFGVYTANYVIALFCLIPYFFLRFLISDNVILGLVLAVICTVAVAGLTISGIKIRLRRMCYA